MGEILPQEKIFGHIITGVSYIARPAAYAVIRDSQGRIAAVNTRLGYFLPGGGIEPQESPETTVKREIREELGRNAAITGKLGEAIQYFSVDGQHYRAPVVFFAAEFISEPQGESEYALCWLEPDELKRGCFHECHAWATLSPEFS
jgi:8-oxo-dGTP diphosphatase